MIEEGILVLAKQATPTLGGRFYAELPKAVTYPSGVMRAGIGGSSEPTFQGRGVQRERYQFDFAGMTRTDVTAARDALIEAFDGFDGALPNGFPVIDIEFIQKIGLPFDGEKRVFWCACEFYVKFGL